MRRSFVTLSLLLLIGACTGGAGDRADERGSDSRAAPVPEARTEVAGGMLGNRLAVLGGLRADGSATDRVDLFDPIAGRWSAGPALPRPVHHAAAAVFQGRLYLIGGYTTAGAGTWQDTAEVWSLGPGETSWRGEPPLSAPRGAPAAGAASGRLLVFGGTSAGRVVAATEVLIAGADSWRAAPPMAQAREHLAAASTADRVYAIGGRVGGLDTNLSSVESIAPGAFSPEWRAEPEMSTARGGTAGTAVGGTVCAAGGEEPAGTIASVECLDDGAWRQVGQLAVPRHGLAVVAFRGRLHVLAGGPQPGLFVSDAHEVIRIG